MLRRSHRNPCRSRVYTALERIMAPSGTRNARPRFGDFWCIFWTSRPTRPAELQIIHPATSKNLVGVRDDFGRSNATKIVTTKEQPCRDDCSLPCAVSPTSVLSPDDPAQSRNSLYASNASSGLLNFVCDRPAGSPKADMVSRDAPLAILPWSIGFLPQTTSATVGGASSSSEPLRVIDIGGGGSQPSGNSYPWKPLGAMTLEDWGAVNSTIIGIAAHHRMEGVLNSMDDVAAIMRGLKEEIQRWLQSELLSPPELEPTEVPLRSVLCHVTESHALWKSTQSQPITCTCAFSQAWARITFKTATCSSSSPSSSPTPGFGHTCTCSTSGISYEAAWAQVCGSSAPESDAHLELPSARRQVPKSVPLNPNPSFSSYPLRPYKSLSKSPLGFLVRAPSARFTLADSSLDTCPPPESLKIALGSPLHRMLRPGLPPTPLGEGGRSGSRNWASEKVKAWLETGDQSNEAGIGPSPSQKAPDGGLSRARGWNSVGRSGRQLEELALMAPGWGSVGRSGRSGRIGRSGTELVTAASLQEEFLRVLTLPAAHVPPTADVAPQLPVRACSFPNVVTFQDIMANVVEV